MLEKMDQWGYGTCAELYEWGRGVDLKIFTPERRSMAFRESKQMLDTDVVVIWVGRLVPEKRPDIWLNTVKRLQSEGLPVRAIVVGNGTYEKTLAQLKNVTCCGWLSGPALGEAYASSDVLLFPSDVETFGNVTLEALASGCPCVVEEKCGGHLVEYGVNGFTCPAGDFEAFYQATKRIVQDVALRKQMAVKAREGSWAFERHKIMQQMLENYKVSTPHYFPRSTAEN
jgi:phosphatidylinositol alpha 1,6-mannosyltransferase